VSSKTTITPITVRDSSCMLIPPRFARSSPRAESSAKPNCAHSPPATQGPVLNQVRPSARFWTAGENRRFGFGRFRGRSPSLDAPPALEPKRCLRCAPAPLSESFAKPKSKGLLSHGQYLLNCPGQPEHPKTSRFENVRLVPKICGRKLARAM
jgi:hypothetical protein